MLVGIAKMAAESPLQEEKRRVQYLELPAKSFVGSCSGKRKIFDWTVNPYRGCEYGCRYCYARYTHEFMELDVGQFETRIFVKKWDAVEFRREIRKLAPGDSIAFGTATDCYQPAERRFGLMRRMLEELRSQVESLRIYLITKSDLVARDIDLLSPLARRNDVRVSMTVTTTDRTLARKLEPLAPRPELRLEAIRRLSDAGVATGVGLSPLMPRINDSMESMDAVGSRAKAAGARTLWGQALFLRECSRKVFLPWLQSEFPGLYSRYRAWYAQEAYLKGPYVEELEKRTAEVRERYGLASRGVDYRPPDWEGPAQGTLFDAAVIGKQ